MAEPVNPGLPEDQWKRLFDAHRADVTTTANEHDPASPTFKRPDLAKAYTERAEAVFREIVDRAVVAHRARTAAGVGGV
jgi:hypothetical protein